MAENRNIDLLVEELRSLKIRVEQVEAILDEYRALDEVEEDKQTRTTARGDRAQSTLVEAPPSPRTTYEKGDRVRIVNKVRKPATWPVVWNDSAIENERRATVTHVVQHQVWIVTDNGTKTWRAPNNLKRL